jgi:hypothetical protein
MFGGLVAGGVLELDVRMVGGDLQHRLHVAEGGAEDQLVALAGQVANTRSASAHLLDEGGHDLVAEFLLQRLAGVVVREGPAAVAHRADVGEGDLQRLGLGGHGGRRGGLGSGRRGLFLLAAAHQGHGGGQGGPAGHCSRRRLEVTLSFMDSPGRKAKKRGWERVDVRPRRASRVRSLGERLAQRGRHVHRIQVGLREISTSTTMVAR